MRIEMGFFDRGVERVGSRNPFRRLPLFAKHSEIPYDKKFGSFECTNDDIDRFIKESGLDWTFSDVYPVSQDIIEEQFRKDHPELGTDATLNTVGFTRYSWEGTEKRISPFQEARGSTPRTITSLAHPLVAQDVAQEMATYLSETSDRHFFIDYTHSPKIRLLLPSLNGIRATIAGKLAYAEEIEELLEVHSRKNLQSVVEEYEARGQQEYIIAQRQRELAIEKIFAACTGFSYRKHLPEITLSLKPYSDAEHDDTRYSHYRTEDDIVFSNTEIEQGVPQFEISTLGLNAQRAKPLSEAALGTKSQFTSPDLNVAHHIRRKPRVRL